MKFTISWLEKFLDLKGVEAEVIISALTNLGLEVESVVYPSPLLKQFIVAEVVECKKHPTSDKLSVCSVTDGTNLLQIICGAPNVRAGLKIVLAPLGSVVPANGLKIERRKIRDVESEGMICSASELGLGEDSGLIMELEPDLKTGNRFIDECPWAQDTLIDISVTPNRGDCLGVYGIARDLAAYGVGKLKALPPIKINPAPYPSPIGVIVENTQACPLFLGLYFKGIDNSKQSPVWLKAALNSIGEKSISPAVDITNYMNYSFGRPMHAFDADKLEGDLTVRLAKKGEEVLSLSGDQITLVEQDVVVADDHKVCALGGIVGGENSKCTAETKNIFLEAAVFDSIVISNTGQRTKINSDARYRFERGIDHDFTLTGIEIATDMIKEICGGEASDILIIGNPVAPQKIITFELDLLVKLGGTAIKKERAKEILQKLGFEITNDAGDSLEVLVPSWRNDVSIPEDLVEEILRINGYDNIPTIPIPTTKTINSVSIPAEDSLELRTRSTLAALGFDEMITWSFMSSKLAKSFGLLEQSPALANPISAELDVLRVSLIPNLLSCIYKNNARSFHDLSLFEIGNVFENKTFSQTKMICAVRSGKTSEDNIFKDSRSFDFFDIKGDVVKLLESVFSINSDEITFVASKELPSWYHPGKSAIILLGNKTIGYLGELHPSTLKLMDINRPTAATELFIQDIPYKAKPVPTSLSNYQIVSRDFAFVINKSVQSSELTTAIQALANPLIKTIHLFDLFTGAALGEDKKSIALRVTLQAQDHSLTEQEINTIATQVIEAVQAKTKATLRE
jgi:phenylalanyl-tRNA synthetase beta chain